MALESSVGLYNTISVGTSATEIVNGTSKRASLLIQNADATAVLYVGTSDAVTTSTGTRVNAGESISFDDYLGPVYGIASEAADDIRFIEIGG